MTTGMMDDSLGSDDSPKDDDVLRGDLTAAFEQAIVLSDEEHYCLRLYIAGATLRSAEAIRNLKHICEEYLQGRYTLEIIDVYKSPENAAPENIIAVPTLIKALPPPLQRLIGDLSNTEKVLIGLNLRPRNEVP